MKKIIDINRFIGNKIFEARNAAGMNRTALARQIGVSSQQILKYENGTDQVSIARLFLITEVLPVTLDYFLKDIHPTEWSEETLRDQRFSLNVSNNFMKIKSKLCKKALDDLIAALAQIA